MLLLCFVLLVVFSIITQLFLPIRPVCFYESMCYIRYKYRASRNKAWHETTPSNPFRTTPPLSTFSNGHGGGKMEGWEAEKLQLGHKGWHEEAPSFTSLCRQSRGPLSGYRAHMCQMEETHTFNRRASPRAHLPGVVSVRVCVKAFNGCPCLCVSMCVHVCVCVCGGRVLMCLLVINEYIKCHQAIYSTQTRVKCK